MPLRAPDDTIEFHASSMRDGELLNEHLFDRVARFQILSERSVATAVALSQIDTEGIISAQQLRPFMSGSNPRGFRGA